MKSRRGFVLDPLVQVAGAVLVAASAVWGMIEVRAQSTEKLMEEQHTALIRELDNIRTLILRK